MHADAFHGLAGRVVRTLAPHTEADPAGMLLTFLAAFGAAVGNGPHAVADGAEHPCRLNVALVGRSSRARKGTSWSVIKKVFAEGAPDFVSDHVIGGLASGEGLVADLARRPVELRNVLVLEPELARLLRVGARSATLSALVREAWDGGELSIRTRKDPLRADEANVGLLGHCTADELRLRLSTSDVSNGFGNRFLFGWVERSQRLPQGSPIPDAVIRELGDDLHWAIRSAETLDVVRRTSVADRLWTEIYMGIDDNVPGVVGSLLARCEAQVLRLSVTFAVLDSSPLIQEEHLRAAWAVWLHCEETVRRVFSGAPVDPIRDRLLRALRDAGDAGLDGTQMRDLFARHVSGAHLARVRRELAHEGLIETTTEATGGRPRIWSRALPAPLPEPGSLLSPRSQIPSQPELPFVAADRLSVEA